MWNYKFRRMYYFIAYIYSIIAYTFNVTVNFRCDNLKEIFFLLFANLKRCIYIFVK